MIQRIKFLIRWLCQKSTYFTCVYLFLCNYYKTPRNCVPKIAIYEQKLKLKYIGLKAKSLYITYGYPPATHCVLIFQTCKQTWHVYDPIYGSWPIPTQNISIIAGYPDPALIAHLILGKPNVVCAEYEEDYIKRANDVWEKSKLKHPNPSILLSILIYEYDLKNNI